MAGLKQTGTFAESILLRFLRLADCLLRIFSLRFQVIQLVAQQFLTTDSRNVGNEMWQGSFVAGGTLVHRPAPDSIPEPALPVQCFFFLVSRTRHHSCAGHCFTIRSHCNFFRNATIPPGRIKQQRKTKQTATKQNQQRNTNQTQTENQTPEWKLSSLILYNIQLK